MEQSSIHSMFQSEAPQQFIGNLNGQKDVLSEFELRLSDYRRSIDVDVVEAKITYSNLFLDMCQSLMHMVTESVPKMTIDKSTDINDVCTKLEKLQKMRDSMIVEKNLDTNDGGNVQLLIGDDQKSLDKLKDMINEIDESIKSNYDVQDGSESSSDDTESLDIDEFQSKIGINPDQFVSCLSNFFTYLKEMKIELIDLRNELRTNVGRINKLWKTISELCDFSLSMSNEPDNIMKVALVKIINDTVDLNNLKLKIDRYGELYRKIKSLLAFMPFIKPFDSQHQLFMPQMCAMPDSSQIPMGYNPEPMTSFEDNLTPTQNNQMIQFDSQHQFFNNQSNYAAIFQANIPFQPAQNMDHQSKQHSHPKQQRDDISEKTSEGLPEEVDIKDLI